ncbi:anti-sigma factor domain-containing protein [Methylobacterium sp. J-068]|uniref:anti-sigma factor n=1 Tax=Methylobacterium sp. J-068 TaxID=2836649 RepID=UPI001FB8B84D|nr:anti-sigma factor [Methylobacterium sp. J-068]MCJ2035678.1 anti-sigma factor [Methylobacterium sp. J-068]
MTPDPNERDLRLAEYVLGTLTPPERAAVDLELAVDPAARAARAAWDRRLAPLALAAPEAEPGPGVWPAIARSIAQSIADETARPLAANDDRIGALQGSLRRWRLAAGTAAALAAGLALFIAVGPPRPGDGDGRYLAVVNSGGEAPALLVSIDTRAGTARVRPVGAQAPAGHSLELWYVGAGQAPKTLGLVGTGAHGVTLPVKADAQALTAGSFAVSVEPEGGSPTGQPTGPVVYSGRLIRD